jgi:hypothetical protein
LRHSGLLNCFSYPADVPPVSGNRDAAQSAQCGWLACFSYPAEVRPVTGTRNAAYSAQSGWLNRLACAGCRRVAPASATDRAPAAHPLASI